MYLCGIMEKTAETAIYQQKSIRHEGKVNAGVWVVLEKAKIQD